jgi:ATP-dependent exoDNAse (exonuclease V) alpha subunit
VKVEVNSDFKSAFEAIENSNACVFITGNAGTGKTTFLRYFVYKTNKKVVVLAPTGVAALNAGGETIHSFFKFKPNTTYQKIKKIRLREDNIYKQVETIVIDEASMLRCDLLDCIDKFLRLNRDSSELFGGVQIVFIGDLKQLPPIVRPEEKLMFSTHYDSPYFLSSACLKNTKIETIELKKIYRQTDAHFIEILNSIRHENINDAMLKELNNLVENNIANEGFTVYLTTTNKKAHLINSERLQQIKGPEYTFIAESKNIDIKKNQMPADTELFLKRGAQVMMLNNDYYGRWVNGSIGIVEKIAVQENINSVMIHVKFPDERIEEVGMHSWDIYKYEWNAAAGQIEMKSAGYFKQYPLKLAWAVTIHKSQGKTFENVIIDMESGAFAPGQLYVALSRCVSFRGIKLARPISKRDIFMRSKYICL